MTPAASATSRSGCSVRTARRRSTPSQAADEPRRSAAFPDGGFYVLRNPSSHLFIDCGDVGMRGRGGHGHNDILSFELFMNGANIVTDCGAYVYTASRDWRNRFRSTAFHNTIQVDDEEVNRFVEPNALWQLVDDAKPAEVRWGFGPSGGFLAGQPYRLSAAATAKHAVSRDVDGRRAAGCGVQGWCRRHRPPPGDGSAGISIPSAR